MSKPRRFLRVIGPGLLVAATGVGAGDLATGAFAGSKLGVAVLWAVIVGALLKFVVNEGLARWQLATGETVLEGAIERFGKAVAIVFLPYLFLWTYFVGAALMSACGVTAHALLPIFEDATRAKIVFGIAHSALGLALVLAGGFKLFEKVMSVCIGVMFVTVVVTAACLWPGTGAVLRGLFVPAAETLRDDGLNWSVALLGGVGGTVTVLCYGYWMRESDRGGESELGACRLDLGLAYTMTAVFGIAMVIIGSQVSAGGKGAGLVVALGQELERPLGPIARWAFLIGAWGAVFSSLLGVWQAVPYLFADVLVRLRRRDDLELTKTFSYRAYLLGIATVPIIGLFVPFERIQKLYAIVGAAFVPLLALALLVLNGRRDWVGERLRNRWPSVVALVASIVILAGYVWTKF